MRVLYIIVILCFLGVYAQRRSSKSDTSESETSSPRSVSRSRGKTRFSITPEFEELNADYETVTKQVRKTEVPRRKPEHAKPTEKRPSRPAKEPASKTRPYEVKEVVDDIPETRRVNKKPRIVTESRFEAANAPPKKELFTPASPAPDDLPPNLSSFAAPSGPESLAEETALPAQLTTIPINAIASSTEKLTEESSKSVESLETSSISEISKTEPDTKRKQVEPPPSTTRASEPRRVPHGRINTRTKANIAHKTEEQATLAPRSRVRTRPTKAEEPARATPSEPNPRPKFRAGRRRVEATAESVQDPVKTRGPSVFSAVNSHELPPRARTGRKVSSASERGNNQRNASSISRSRNGRTNDLSTSTTTTTNAPERIDLNVNSRRPTSTSTNAPEKVDLNLNSRRGSSTNAPEKVELNLNNRRGSSRRGTKTVEESNRRSINPPTSSTTNAPEKIDLNLDSRRTNVRRGSKLVESTSSQPSTSRISHRGRNSKEASTPIPLKRRASSRTTTQRNAGPTTQQNERQSRGRLRSRSFLTLNEQQLEVLPLFETEPKIVSHNNNYDAVTIPTRTSLGRRRSLNSAEDIATASTKQSQVKLNLDAVNQELPTSTQSNIRVSRQQSISVETKTEKAIRKVYKKRPNILTQKFTSTTTPEPKENQVKDFEVEVSTRKIRPLNVKKNNVKENVKDNEKEKSEDKNVRQTVKIDEPKVSFRQVVRRVSQKVPSGKTKEKLSQELTNSQEDIGESDNYPAPFKAALQAKKNKKEGPGSRSAKPNELSVTKTPEKTVTSSTITYTIQQQPSDAAPAAENVVNADEETNHKSESESTTITPSTKFPRPRFSLTSKYPRSTENPSESSSTHENSSNRPSFTPRKHKLPKSKFTPTTTTTQSFTEKSEGSSTGTPLQKFHARFKSTRNQKDKDTEVHVTPRTAHKSRSYSPKAPKGVYSSRKFAKTTTAASEESESSERPKPPKFNVETSALPTKVPLAGNSVKTANRFSSRYRNDILSRSAGHRTSTSGPLYIPTVPTITPPPTSEHYWPEEDFTEYHWFNNRIY